MKKKEEEIAKNTFACQLQRRALRRALRRRRGAHAAAGAAARHALPDPRRRRGVRYSNGTMELRGKGIELQLDPRRRRDAARATASPTPSACRQVAGARSCRRIASEQPAVGVIGTGAMGMGVVREPAARAASRRTRATSAPRRKREAARAGRHLPPDAAALGRARATSSIVLVVDAAQVDDVLFGADGAAAALRAGRDRRARRRRSTPSTPRRSRRGSRAHGVALRRCPGLGRPARAPPTAR